MRPIEEVIHFVNGLDSFSPVEKKIIERRLSPGPSWSEITAAKAALQAEAESADPH